MAVSSAHTVTSIAKMLGFLDSGIAKPVFLDTEARYYEQWLKKQQHGTMTYLERQFDTKVNPKQFLSSVKSIIVVLLNYYPQSEDIHYNQQPPFISTYAWGKDYHLIFRERLFQLAQQLQSVYGSFEYRLFADAAPVMDKVWASRAGLGWIGKHTNLIQKRVGSFFFIGGLFTDLDLTPSIPQLDHCGSCTRCIDACPTQALTAYQIDSSRCISYLTIELKEKIPEKFRDQLAGWAYGCDICQDVCPWNRFATPHNDQDLKPRSLLSVVKRGEFALSSNRAFKKQFAESAIIRVKPEKLLDNLTAALDSYSTE